LRRPKRLDDQITRLVKQHLSKITRGICPTYDAAVEVKQAGACVVGSCGHRLYHGYAPDPKSRS
jgi:hypothetical protein